MIWAIRVLAAAGGVLTGYLCLAFTGLAGWNAPASRTDQFLSALPALGLSLGFGLLTALMVLTALGSRRYVWLVAGALPALVQAALVLS